MEEEKQVPVKNVVKNRINKKDTKKINYGIFVIVVLLVCGFVYLLFNYFETKKELRILKDPTAQEELSKIETQKLVKTVSKLIDLPEDQEPVVGTVNDANALSEQQKFFINSQNGDKVLIYQDKAIIYRPSENKLINVGPVYINSTSTEDNIN